MFRSLVCVGVPLILTAAVPRDAAAAAGDVLPAVKAESLAGKKIAWPTDFAAERTILLFSFGRDMQDDVDAWDAALAPLRAAGTAEVYNTPLIPNPGALVRGFISGGMRSVYKDPATRARVVVLFVDEKTYFPALGVTDRTAPLVLVVGRDGVERGRVQGKVNDALIADVRALAN